MILTATFLAPAVIAILVGLRGFRDRPRTAGEFAMGALWAFLFGAAWVVAWHVVWLGAAAIATGAGAGLAGGVAFNTAVSALLWFPCLMISYTFNAQRGLHDDR
ncbi:MAG: hypothetical protein AAFP13_11880 [Pseudomonadota bacterium]